MTTRLFGLGIAIIVLPLSAIKNQKPCKLSLKTEAKSVLKANKYSQITMQNGDWRAFHKTIALNDTYTTVPLDIDMGGVFEVFVNATYDGFYNFDAARLSNTSIRVRCFRSGIQQTSGNVQISILVIK